MAVPAPRDALRRCRWLLPDLSCDGQSVSYRTHEARVTVERFCSSDPNRVHRRAHELCVLGWAAAWAPEEGG